MSQQSILTIDSAYLVWILTHRNADIKDSTRQFFSPARVQSLNEVSLELFNHVAVKQGFASAYTLVHHLRTFTKEQQLEALDYLRNHKPNGPAITKPVIQQPITAARLPKKVSTPET